MKYIEGINRYQKILLPDMLDDYISEENPVRVLDAYVDSLDMKALGFTISTADTGRPPYNPQDLLKLYIYGYFNRIRSSRRLETESIRNLELIWLLNKLSPDHKTIARFRHDNPVALKNVFKDFVRLCLKLDLYSKELVAIDGSKFKAVNSKDRNFTEKKLAERIARLSAKIDEYTKQLDECDCYETLEEIKKSPKEIKAIISELNTRKELYTGYAQQMAQANETQISLTDPDSRLMMANGKTDVCYNVQTAVDAKNKMVVDFEVTNNASDANQLAKMANKAADLLQSDTLTLTTDAGYDSVEDIVKCMESGFDTHVAGTDFDVCLPCSEEEKEEIDSHHNGRAFYIPDRNIVLCPMGNVLYPRFYKTSSGEAVYYNRSACKECRYKCTKEARGRRHQVPMKESDFSKEYDDSDLSVKQIRITPDKEIVSQRKLIAEHPFGTLKRAMDAGYCLLKGIHLVSAEFSLAFLAFNLKRAINILGVNNLVEAIQA